MNAKPADFTSAVQGVISPLIPTLARAHRAMSQELLRDTGLSAGQELIVMRLFDSPPRSQAELTRWLGVEPPTTAKTVRHRGEKTLVTDGPYAESKEVLGGFILIEARDMEEAVRIAENIPVGKFASIEVRPEMKIG